jgi:hypothetical protein
MEQALAVDLRTTPLDDVLATGAVELGAGAIDVAIGLPPAD